MINAALFIGWALAVVLFDCRLRRIPNWLVLAGLALACAVVASGHSPFQIHMADAAIGLIGGFLGLLPFYWFGVMGAADVKVFATLGAWCGVHALPALWIAASIAGGIHALYLLASAAIDVRRTVRAAASPASAASKLDVVDMHEAVEGDGARTNHYTTFVVGGRRATPYAGLLAVSAIGSLMLHVLEAAR